MYSVISSKSAPHHLPQLREWFVAEWGHIDPFEGVETSLIIPPPLLIVADENLIGGLTFGTFPIPSSKVIGVWINALFVKSEYRGNGLGTQLILAAETEVAVTNKSELFVHTDYPELYQRLDWQIVESSDKSYVLKKAH